MSGEPVIGVVCELSGGADSALAAIRAHEKYSTAKIYFLFIDYGQKYAIQEEVASVEIAKSLDIKDSLWHRIRIQGLFQEDSSNGIVAEYFPVRNLVLTAVSASYAIKNRAQVVITGSKSLGKVPTDPFSFRDSTLGFYALMQAAVRGAMEQGSLRIEPILAEGRDRKMEKVEVYRQLLEHRIDPRVTWSCYHPRLDGEVCGACRNCLEKQNCMLLLKNRISALHGQD